MAGVDAALGGDLVRRAPPQHSALAHVRALGVLADDDEVVARGDEWTLVHVQVELEPQLEQQPSFDDSRRHVGRPDGPEQDGVEGAELIQGAVGQHLAVPQEASAAEVELDGSKPTPAARSTFSASAVTSGPIRRPRSRRSGAAVPAAAWWGNLENESSRPASHGTDRLDEPWNRTSCPKPPSTGCGRSSTTSPPAVDSRSRGRSNAARELGDLTENGDYQAAKDEQGHLEGRIRQLEAIIEHAEIIEAPQPGVVGPGSIVTLVYEGDSDDAAERYLVGHIEERSGELDVISPTAPLGAALIGHRAGDTVSFEAPTGELRVRVLQVEAA